MHNCFIQCIQLRPTGYAFIINSNGNVVCHPLLHDDVSEFAQFLSLQQFLEFLGGTAFCSANDFAYSYTFLCSVLCLSVCLSSVTFILFN